MTSQSNELWWIKFEDSKSILPRKPFDGNMNILMSLLFTSGGFMLSAFAFIASFIYYYLVQYLHWTTLTLLLPTFVAEMILLYVNNDARIKYKNYFKELNPLWSNLDEVSTKLSMIFQFSLVIGISIITLLVKVEIFFFVYGILCLNLMLDYVTTTQRITCVKMRCPYLENRIVCLQCMNSKKKGEKHG